MFKVSYICYILTQFAKTLHPSKTHIGFTNYKWLVWYLMPLKTYGISARTF